MPSWKLHTIDRNMRDPVTSSSEHESLSAALERACDLSRHVRAEYIQCPDGTRIEGQELEKRCVEHRAKRDR